MPAPRPVCDPWPLDRTCWNLPATVTEAEITRWSKVATQLLYRLSGGVFGPSCPVTVRPCRLRCGDGGWGWSWLGSAGYLGAPWIPYVGADGLWRNQSVCGCRTSCSCTELCELLLPGPVYDVVSVTDGTLTLPSTAYRVDNASRLVRTDGNCFADCYDQQAACGTAGTLCVTYRTGFALDDAAIAAVSALTEHYVRGCSGCGCGVASNRNVTRVNRQGVTMEFPDPSDLAEGGRTGLELVDSWLATVNPSRLTAPLRVLSPDFRAPRSTTWP
jgi:hypothetical protein